MAKQQALAALQHYSSSSLSSKTTLKSQSRTYTVSRSNTETKNPNCLVPRGTGVCKILNSAPDWSDFQGTILDLENNIIAYLSFSAPDWLRLI